jgi:hypothetical protein
MVVDGRTLVKAGQEATASGGYGLDKGPAIDRTRCQQIEGQERASGRPAPATHPKGQQPRRLLGKKNGRSSPLGDLPENVDKANALNIVS